MSGILKEIEDSGWLQERPPPPQSAEFLAAKRRVLMKILSIEETNEEIRTIGLLFRHRASVVNDICYILENYVNDTLLLKAFTAQLITQLVNFHSNTQDESKISNNDLSKEIVEIYPLLLALKACLKTLKHNHKSLYKINAFNIDIGQNSSRIHKMNCTDYF